MLTIAAAHAVHDTYSAFLPPLLPVFISRMLLSKTEAGLLSVFLQAPSLIQPAIGHLADRMNLRPVVILAPAVTAVAMSLLGAASGYAALAVLLTVAGLSSAALHAVAPVIAGRISGASLGKGMSFWMVGGEVGRTLGPVIVVTALLYLTLEGLPWLMIGGVLASLLLYIRLRDVPGTPPRSVSPRPWRTALRTMRPVLVPVAGVIVVRAFLLSALQVYLPTFLTEEGADIWFAGASLTVLQAAGVGGALVSGPLSDRWGRRRILAVAMVGAPLALFAFTEAAGAARIVLLLVMGFTAISTTPVVMALVQESFPENRALANGIYMALGFAIRSVAVILVGVVADLFGMRVAFLGSAVLMLAGTPLLLALPRRRAAP